MSTIRTESGETSARAQRTRGLSVSSSPRDIQGNRGLFRGVIQAASSVADGTDIRATVVMFGRGSDTKALRLDVAEDGQVRRWVSVRAAEM